MLNTTARILRTCDGRPYFMMQEIQFKYKRYIEGTINTFSPIYWLLNIFSISSPLSEQKDVHMCRHVLRISVSASILFGVTLFTLYYKVQYVFQVLSESVKYTDAVQAVYDYFQYVIDLLFVFKYGTDVYYEYIKQYACIDEVLGITFNNQIKRRLVKVMAIIYCMWLCSSVYDYVVWVIGFGFFPTSAYSLAYLYIFIKILTNLELTTHVMHIESRLRVIADTIHESYSSFENICNKIEDTVTKSNWFYSEYSNDTRIRPVKKESCLNSKDVKCLSRCYLLLTEQVMFINKMFGMRILLNSLGFLIDIVRYTNLAVRVLVGSQHTGYNSGFLPAISTILKVLTYITALVSLVSHCEQTYRQRERIIRLIDHMIFDKNLDDQLLPSFKSLRGLIESREIAFHMANFSTLNYPLLVSITSVVVTYTIILLQTFN